MFKLLREYWGLVLTLIIAVVFAVFYYFGPFLDNYDAAGHRIMIDGMREFWPWPIGWDNNTFLGHMSGAAYPMLMHWLMTGLSFIVGTSIAMKLFVIIAIIALPITIYWYVKNQPNKWLGLLSVFAILLILPGYIGGNFSGLFSYGLIPAFTVMPVFFTFLACLDRIENNKKIVVWSTVLFGVIMWSHIVAAMAAGAFVLAKLFGAKNSIEIRKLLVIIAFGAVIGAPLLISTVLTASDVIQLQSSIPTLLLVNISALLTCLVLSTKLKLWGKSAELRAAVILLAFLILVSIMAKVPHLSLIHHGYRLQLFAYIFTALAVSQSLQLKKRHQQVITILVAVALLLLTAYRLIDVIRTTAYVEMTKTVSGRFIEIFRRTEAFPSTYAGQQRLVETGGEWANGLFRESAPNAPFVQSLVKSKRPEAYADLGSGLDEIIKTPEDTDRLLGIFGITHVISLDDDPQQAIGILRTSSGTLYYHDTYLGAVDRVQAIDPSQLKPVYTDWNQTVDTWWRSKTDYYLYDASKGEMTASIPARNVDVIEYSRTKIRVRVDSDAPAPILIKETFNNNWRATDINGNTVNICKFSPFLMLIEAKGEITLTI